MRFFLVFLVLFSFTFEQAIALECANSGTAPTTAPDDSGFGDATACGNLAVASGDGSIALGYGANSAGARSAALGRYARANGYLSTAIGFLAESEGQESAAVGREASSIGRDSTALGWMATSTGGSSMALGKRAHSEGISTAALGVGARAIADFSTAIGYAAYSLGEGSSALGSLAQADRPYSVVLGAIDGVNFAEQYSNVGIGVTSPLAPLHIHRDDDTQEMLFLESNQTGDPQDRAMIQLVNNGGIRFQFDNPVLATAWRFQAATGDRDNFEITKVGTGEIEFRVDADGNAYLAGMLFENSDRNTKTNITPVDPEEVLNKVTQLPIAEWAYKESPESRHIGPMAQDFHAAFATGVTDKQLATMDVGGVAIASIQALESRNKALENKNKELEERLSQLEAVVGQLLPKVVQN